MSDLPQGAGPVISSIVVDAEVDDTSASAAPKAVIETPDLVIFSLGGAGEATSPDAPTQVIPVMAMPEIGSEPLARALADEDLAAVLEALAFNMVLLPVTISADGAVVTRIFASAEAEPGAALCLFSSAVTLEQFLVGDSEQTFVIQHGAAVVDYLTHHLEEVQVVVFDPAGPHSMILSAAVLASFLDDDDTSDADDPNQLEPTGEPLEGPLPAVIGFDLQLDANWGTIDLTTVERQESQIKKLVADQTRTLGDDAALLRRELTTWLTTTANDAMQVGGSEMGFLVARKNEVAAAMSVVTYCHSLGADSTVGAHLDRLADHLASKAEPEDELVRVEHALGPILRHSRVRGGDERLGGQVVQLLNIDYWLAAPDGDHVGHISFSTPHLEAVQLFTKLADNVVFNGRWLVEDTTK
jgi:hypothetical protein